MPAPAQVAKARIDRLRYELSLDGHRVKLERQPMELLILFAQRPGQLVSRDEIVDRLWGKDVFVDAERSINAAVRKIRSALHDDPANPQYLETVVGKGYRFIGNIELTGGPTERPAPTVTADAISQPTAIPRRKSLRVAQSIFTILVAAAAISAIALWWQRTRNVPQAGIRSIAVLPLQNLSGDPAQDYFADGMTEELTTQLAQISALKVISHTSVVQYKGTRKSTPQIARELGVDAVVEGAVERSGDNVEITVQLIEAPADRHLWANSYERDLRDVLALQREVTHAIVNEIQAKLTVPEKGRLANSRAVNSEAYQDYLHGRYLLSGLDEGATRKAIAYFQLAIQKDPGCASAYAGIAEAYITLGQPWVGALPPKEALAQAKAAATTAITIDDSLSEAHSALGHVIELYDWDWQGAEKQYRRALDLNSNDANAHFWYGEYLQAMGRNEEGFVQMRQAMSLDPLNSGPVAELGSQFRTARRYDDAIRTFHDVFELEPDSIWAHTGLGWAYEQKQMYRDARAEFEKALRLSNRSDDTTLASLGKVLGESGRKQDARNILQELRDRGKRRYVSQYLVALVQVGLGNRDQAIGSLEQAYSDRDQWMIYLNVDPGWDDLRSDHRFQDLLRRVGLHNPDHP
jgi:TolB-like protein/DNA-binding winged helix-turn-helix (wHTH) protein/Tfp pilus assembly protein PilF